MKKVILTSIVLVAAVALTSCASSTEKQIKQLQQTQNKLNDDASYNLANVDELKTKIIKYRQEADSLQKESNSMANDIKDLNAAYSQFNDPNNDSAIAVNEELTKKTLQKVKIDEKINQYRSQANKYEIQIKNLKMTSQTEANQASKISQQVNQLKTNKK